MASLDEDDEDLIASLMNEAGAATSIKPPAPAAAKPAAPIPTKAAHAASPTVAKQQQPHSPAASAAHVHHRSGGGAHAHHHSSSPTATKHNHVDALIEAALAGDDDLDDAEALLQSVLADESLAKVADNLTPQPTTPVTPHRPVLAVPVSQTPTPVVVAKSLVTTATAAGPSRSPLVAAAVSGGSGGGGGFDAQQHRTKPHVVSADAAPSAASASSGSPVKQGGSAASTPRSPSGAGAGDLGLDGLDVDDIIAEYASHSHHNNHSHGHGNGPGHADTSAAATSAAKLSSSSSSSAAAAPAASAGTVSTPSAAAPANATAVAPKPDSSRQLHVTAPRQKGDDDATDAALLAEADVLASQYAHRSPPAAATAASNPSAATLAGGDKKSAAPTSGASALKPGAASFSSSTSASGNPFGAPATAATSVAKASPAIASSSVAAKPAVTSAPAVVSKPTAVPISAPRPAPTPSSAAAAVSDDAVPPSRGHRPPTDEDMDLEAILKSYSSSSGGGSSDAAGSETPKDDGLSASAAERAVEEALAAALVIGGAKGTKQQQHQQQQPQPAARRRPSLGAASAVSSALSASAATATTSTKQQPLNSSGSKAASPPQPSLRYSPVGGPLLEGSDAASLPGGKGHSQHHHNQDAPSAADGDTSPVALWNSAISLRKAAQREGELLAAGNAQLISPLASRRKRHRSGYAGWIQALAMGRAATAGGGGPVRRRPDQTSATAALKPAGPPSRRGSVDSTSYAGGGTVAGGSGDAASLSGDTEGQGDGASTVGQDAATATPSLLRADSAGSLVAGGQQANKQPQHAGGRMILRNGRGLTSSYRPYQSQSGVPEEVASALLASPDLAQALPLPSYVEGDKPRMGVMRVDRLARLSEQLGTYARAHATAAGARAGSATSPGLPTCLAVHQKFIAVGTSRSLLLIYDHFQELKGVLSRVPFSAPAPAAAASGGKGGGGSGAASAALLAAAVTAVSGQGASDGAVTAIDVCPGQDYVAVGYFSGRVALFDVSNITKGSCLKVLEGTHKAPITAVKFVSPTEPKLLTVDNGGTVNFVTFSRFMGLRWGVDTRCVLDGSRAGQVVAVSVLHPPPSASGDGSSTPGGGASAGGSATPSGSSAGGGGGGATPLPGIGLPSAVSSFTSQSAFGSLIALSTREHTYVLTTQPEIAVVHKWARPPDVPPGALPSLSWARGKVAGTAVWEALEERRAAMELAAQYALDQQQKAATGGADEGGGAGETRSRAGSVASVGGASTAVDSSAASMRAGGGKAQGLDSSFTAVDDAATVTTSSGGARSGGIASVNPSLPKHVAAAAAAARLRAGSSLPLGTGVVTSLAVPVLARSWGHHLQLLQVTPPGGYPPELTNLASLEQGREGHPGAGPHGGPSLSDRAGKVFGSLASALMTDVGAAGPSGLPSPGVGASAAAAAAASGPGSAASTGRPVDFILADDWESQDPVGAIAWLSDSTLAYLTSEQEALVLLDTAECEETDAIELKGAKIVYAAIKAPPSKRAAAAAAAATSDDESGDATPSPSSLTSCSYAPSFLVCDGSLYLLGLDRLLAARVQSWPERVEGLVEEGEWLSALALGLDHYEAVTSAHMAAINAAEQRAKWAAIKATTLLQMAAASGATMHVNAAALVAAAGGAAPQAGGGGAPNAGGGPSSSSSSAAGGPTGASSSSASSAAAAAASLYDPSRFERLRQGPGPAGPHTGIGEALERLVRDYTRTMLAACPEGWMDGPDGADVSDGYDDDVMGGAADGLGDDDEFGLGDYDDGLNVKAPPTAAEVLGRIADPRARHAVAELLALPQASGNSSLMALGGGGGTIPTTTSSLLLSGDVWGIIAAVVIDFCVSIKRTDLLFGELYDAFAAGGHAQPFLEQLEPYIMNRRLNAMPPIVMKAFVEHFRSAGALASVERCLLLLDLSALDLDGAIRTCLRHRLFSALVHVVNRGLRDFALPVDILLAVALEGVNPLGSSSGAGGGKRLGGGGDHGQEVEDELASLSLAEGGGRNINAQSEDGRSRASTGSSALELIVPLTSADRRALAYKLLLYLAYCLTGRSFPHGRRMLPPPPPPSLSNSIAPGGGGGAGGRGGSNKHPAGEAGAGGGKSSGPGGKPQWQPRPGGPQGQGQQQQQYPPPLFPDGLPPLLPQSVYAAVIGLLAVAADPAVASVAGPTLPRSSPFYRSGARDGQAAGGRGMRGRGAPPPGGFGGHSHVSAAASSAHAAAVAMAGTALGWLWHPHQQQQQQMQQQMPGGRHGGGPAVTPHHSPGMLSGLGHMLSGFGAVPPAGTPQVTSSSSGGVAPPPPPLAVPPSAAGGSKGSAPPAAVASRYGTSGGKQQAAPASAAVVPRPSPSSHHHHHHGHPPGGGPPHPSSFYDLAAGTPSSLLPPGQSPGSLRAEVLSLLIEEAPGKFPAVSNSLLTAGGLGPGAKVCSSFPDPFPRMQACLRLDPVTTLTLLARMFTPPADALTAAVWIAEGTEGLLRRRTCLPGDVPRLAAPELAAPSQQQQQAAASGADGEGGGKQSAGGREAGASSKPPASAKSSSLPPPSSSSSSGAPAPGLPPLPLVVEPQSGPSLQTLLQALVTATISLERDRLKVSHPKLLVRSAADPAARHLGTTSSSASSGSAAARKGLSPAAVAAASPLASAVYLFSAFQAARLGPGLQPLIAPHGLAVASDVSGGSGGSASPEPPVPVLPDILFFLALPSPGAATAVPTNPAFARFGAGADGTSSSADTFLPPFPFSDASVHTLLTSWSWHGDAELFVDPLHQQQAAAMAMMQHPAVTSPSPHSRQPPPSEDDSVPSHARWTREDLLVRLLRTVPLSREQRAGLYEQCRLHGHLRAALVLSSQLGDATGVVDGLLRCAGVATGPASGNGSGGSPEATSESAANKAAQPSLTASSPTAQLARRVFRFIRSWSAVCAAAAAAQPPSAAPSSSSSSSSSLGTAPSFRGQLPGDVTSPASAASASLTHHHVYVDGLVPGLLIPGSIPPGAPPSLAAPFLGWPAFESDPGYEVLLAGCVKAALSGGLPLAPDSSGPSAVFRGLDAPFPREAAAAELRSMRAHVLRCLPRLVAVSQGDTAELIIDLFPAEQSPELTAALEKFPRLHYLFLRRYLVRAAVITEEEAADDDEDAATASHRALASATAAAAAASSGSGSAAARDVPGAGGGSGVTQSNLPVTPEIHLRYIGLLCQFAPHGVTRYLMGAAASYPLHATLALVRDVHKNAEATAYLLERTGDVAGALDLMLRTVGDRCGRLGRALAAAAAGNVPASRALVEAALAAEEAEESAAAGAGRPAAVVGGASAGAAAAGGGNAGAGRTQASSLTSVPGGLRTLSPLHAAAGAECDGFAAALTATLALCTRNSNRFASAGGPAAGGAAASDGTGGPISASSSATGSERLWFAVLDMMLERQRDVKAAVGSGRFPVNGDVSLIAGAGKGGGRGLPPLPSSATVAAAPGTGTPYPPDVCSLLASATGRALTSVLSDGVRWVLESMRGSVPLNAVLSKVLSDHSRAEFGAFRETICGMLDSYVYEERILATANSLMARDIFKAAQRLQQGHASALVPARRGKGGVLCCNACDGALAGPPPKAALLAAAGGGGGSGDDEDEEADVTAAHVNAGLVMLFGCGHAFHGACLPDDAAACQLCHAGDGGKGNKGGLSSGGGGGQQKGGSSSSSGKENRAPGSSSSSRKLNNRGFGSKNKKRPVRRRSSFDEASGSGSDNDDEEEEEERSARARGNRRAADAAKAKKSRMSATMGATAAAAAAAVVAAEQEEEDDRDPHAARLRRQREARRAAKPLAELYRELSTAPGSMQVHRVALATAPPLAPGSAEFRIARHPIAFRDTRAMVANCTIAGVDEPPF